MNSSERARSAVVAHAATSLAALVVKGSERASWLNGILTCDVAALAPGTGAWGLILNKQGKIQSEVYVLPAADRIYLSVPERHKEEICAYLDRFLIMEDAAIEIADGQRWVLFHGPRALDLAARVAAEHRGTFAALDLTGLGGAACVLPEGQIAPALAAIAADSEAGVLEPAEWEVLRVERLVPAFEVDYGRSENPHEASLDRRAVSWTKGCYLGQEVVCMQDMRGKVKRRITGLTLPADATVGAGAPVTVPGEAEPVGELTSVIASELLGRKVALARLRTAPLAAGAELTVAGVSASLLDRPV